MFVASIMSAMMEAASTSEKSLNFYQTTRSNNPVDSHFHTRLRENQKFHFVFLFKNHRVLKNCKIYIWRLYPVKATKQLLE
jgi:hypothetical protein